MNYLDGDTLKNYETITLLFSRPRLQACRYKENSRRNDYWMACPRIQMQPMR